MEEISEELPNFPIGIDLLGPGARFSKVPIINGPVKLLLFTCKIEVTVFLHRT